jgi:hypothetical protein
MAYYELFGTLLVPVSTTLSEVLVDTASGAHFQTVDAFDGYFEGLGDIQTYTIPTTGAYYAGCAANVSVESAIAIAQLELGMQCSSGGADQQMWNMTQPTATWADGVPEGAEGIISISVGGLYNLTAGALLFPVISDVISNGLAFSWQGYPGSIFFVYSVGLSTPVAFAAISATP